MQPLASITGEINSSFWVPFMPAASESMIARAVTRAIIPVPTMPNRSGWLMFPYLLRHAAAPCATRTARGRNLRRAGEDGA